MTKLEKEMLAQDLVDKAFCRSCPATSFYEVIADAKGVGAEYREILAQPEFANIEGVLFQRMLDRKCSMIHQGDRSSLDGWV